MTTIDMLRALESKDFITKTEAAELAKTAFAEYTKRSKAAQNTDKAVWDMVLAGGCPNAVRDGVYKIVERYTGGR